MQKIEQRFEKQISRLNERYDHSHEKRHIAPQYPRSQSDNSARHKDPLSLFFNTYRYLLDQLDETDDEGEEPMCAQDLKPTEPLNEEYQYSSFFGDPISIKKDERAISIHINLPNVDKDSLKISYENGTISIVGSSSSSKEEKDANGRIVRSMKRVGSFSKTFTLTESAKQDSMKTDYSNNILTISFELKKVNS
ncbi:MAG: hypothetical protein A2007_05680 [Verrucomicrobia bacterium GWC2_42_7]|nr:MAG: hypothetical protein A2007_05680 [Verrucomicrobia bacterium GWC2_42_7]